MPGFDKPFTSWDGEGFDSKYVLLANNKAQYIEDSNGLDTVECLEFLLDSSSKDDNNIFFSFGYDVAMILKDVRMHGSIGSLQQLHNEGHTRWRGYWLQYIPRKSFMVSKNGRSFMAYDVFGFFQSSFVKAIEQWMPDEDITDIKEGKAGRVDFSIWDMDQIRAYNLRECVLLSSLMDRFRESLKIANLPVSRWDGAGAIASAWLQRENAKQWYAKDKNHLHLEEQANIAYFGGRIELAAWGKASQVYHYDINSAYPFAMTKCPDMSNITWHHVKGHNIIIPSFSLIHIKWNIPPKELKQGLWCPFPWRSARGMILYPPAGEGWYWGIEVIAGRKKFAKYIEVIEGYIIKDGEILSHVFRDPIMRDAKLRLKWKGEKNPANIPIKLGLNSLYGKLAQKKGYGGKEPKWRNIFWAGFITAHTRAMINDAIRLAGDQVVMVMTDSIWSLVPIDLPISPNLGDWTFEENDTSVDFAGAGLYRVYDKEGKSTDFKQRGFGADDIDYRGMIEAWEGKREDVSYSVTLRRFVGIGAALAGPNSYEPHFRGFIESKRIIEPVSLAGTTKRYPDNLSDVFCSTAWHGLHLQFPRVVDERLRKLADREKRLRKKRKTATMEQFSLPFDMWDVGEGKGEIPCSAPYRRGFTETQFSAKDDEEFKFGEDGE